jgi:hypothetical protein
MPAGLDYRYLSAHSSLVERLEPLVVGSSGAVRIGRGVHAYIYPSRGTFNRLAGSELSLHWWW